MRAPRASTSPATPPSPCSAQGKFEKVGETVQLIKSKKRIAGVGAHDLRVIVECEKAKLDVDFYQKTFHSHDYYTAPRPDEKDADGRARQLLVQRPAGGD